MASRTDQRVVSDGWCEGWLSTRQTSPRLPAQSQSAGLAAAGAANNNRHAPREADAKRSPTAGEAGRGRTLNTSPMFAASCVFIRVSYLTSSGSPVPAQKGAQMSKACGCHTRINRLQSTTPHHVRETARTVRVCGHCPLCLVCHIDLVGGGERARTITRNSSSIVDGEFASFSWAVSPPTCTPMYFVTSPVESLTGAAGRERVARNKYAAHDESKIPVHENLYRWEPVPMDRKFQNGVPSFL